MPPRMVPIFPRDLFGQMGADETGSWTVFGAGRMLLNYLTKVCNCNERASTSHVDHLQVKNPTAESESLERLALIGSWSHAQAVRVRAAYFGLSLQTPQTSAGPKKGFRYFLRKVLKTGGMIICTPGDRKGPRNPPRFRGSSLSPVICSHHRGGHCTKLGLRGGAAGFQQVRPTLNILANPPRVIFIARLGIPTEIPVPGT